MNISIITLFPELYETFIKTSLVGKSIASGQINIGLKNLFNFVSPKERVDSPTFGPGSGMLLRPDIVEKAIDSVESEKGKTFKIFFSPQGKKLDQNLLKKLAREIKNKHVILLPARYEGMDSRVEEHYSDCTISIGDYVLMGGDLPAMVLMEGLLRLVPGVVGKESSVQHESFTGPFLDYPEFTEPVVWKDITVPEVIRSGNHKLIDNWRSEQAIRKTVLCHFDWLKSNIKTESDINKAANLIPAHYVVLMHDQVILDQGREGTSSVTSIDIHDIARSACTYGLKKYFIVTPLVDQQKIVRKLLQFWQDGQGVAYNSNRFEALKNVILCDNINQVIEQIEQIEGKKPVLIATSAKQSDVEGNRKITYNDQSKVWQSVRPVLFILGTARGLTKSVIDMSDFVLTPLTGFSKFNHLSVRSAAAIIFDRWLGINLKHIEEKDES